MHTRKLAVVLDQIACDIADYYTDTLKQHGDTPRGVDWSCKPTQELRFVQLMRLCRFDRAVSLNDVGCGYGALREFLHRRQRRAAIDYLGIDLAPAMVDAARLRCGHLPGTRFSATVVAPRVADYSVASGLFNVKLHHPQSAWETWVAHTLQALYDASRIGFAVNFLLPPRPGENGLEALYRPLADKWKSYCESTMQAKADLITDYGMRENTLLVKRL